jgi:hypothetical protein
MSSAKRKSSEEAKTDAKMSRSENGGFFKDLAIYLHPAALSLGRKKIFEKQIQAHGGDLVSDLKDCPNGKHLIVVIDDSSIDKAKLRGLIEKCQMSIQNSGTENVFVGTSWLSTCLEHNIRVPFEPFVLKFKSAKGCSPSQQQQQQPQVSTDPPKSKDYPRAVSTTKFVCSQSSVHPTSSNLNVAITRELEKLAQTYKSSNDRCHLADND